MEEQNKTIECKDMVCKNNKNEIIKKVFSYIITCTIGCTLFIISNIFFKLVFWDKIIIESYTYVFSIIFGIVIYSFIMALTKKASRATKICYIFIFLIGIINELKIIYASEPLYFSDIKFLPNIFGLAKLISPSGLSGYMLKIILYATIMALLLEIIAFLNTKFDVQIKNNKFRISIIIIDIIILLLLFFPNAKMKEFYLKIFFNTDNYVEFKSYTTNIEFYARNGLINGMYGIVLNNRFVEPENYDEEILEKIVKEAENINGEKYGKPNIIVFFSESFWDIEQLSEVEFNKEITSNFNRLKEEGEFVNMISPSYGGMSENVAFEFLTGGSMSLFPKGYIPIMSLYSRKNSENIPSLVKVLNNNGYKTEIIFGIDYYNSEKAYRKLGFQNYRELEYHLARYIPDEYCADIIIRKLKENSKEPLFCVMETIESHMPFYKEKYDEYDISIQKSNLSDEQNEVLTCYAQGMYNADKQLGRLYEFIKSYEEPTILLFFGDHLPYLYTDENNNVLLELDYFNTEDELLNTYRKYNTQALVLSNYEIKNLEIPDYMGVDLLLNYIVNHLDIENEEYYKWLYNTTEILPGVNNFISFDSKGNLYNTNELSNEMKEMYEYRDLIQYKYFINAK